MDADQDETCDTDWLLPPEESTVPAAAPPQGRRTWLAGGGLVAAGAVVGVVVALAVGHGSSSASATPGFAPAAAAPGGGPQRGVAPQQGVAPQRGGVPPQGGLLGGGLDGEQRLQGTLTRVGSSSVTVRTASGAATYAVTSATEIVRDGAPATLAQLKPGDPVFVHVYRTGSGDRMTVERLFAGRLPVPGGPPPGGPPQEDDGTHI